MSTFETQEWENLESMEIPGEWESQEWGETGEYESQEQQFLGGLLGSVLGGELELNEMQETELATELLEISSEEELEQFLGKLIRGAAKAVGGIVLSPVGRARGGALKSVAKTALPMAAGALGNLVLPGVGGVVGSKLGSMASKLFEVELEAMGEQEAEFEVARRYVRFATAAARNAARAPSNAPPRAVVRAAVVSAARRHAPGLVRGTRSGQGRGRPGRGPRPGSYGFPSGAGNGMGGGPGNGMGGGTAGGEPLGFDDDAGPDTGTKGNGSGETGGRAPAGRWIRRGRKIVILGV